MSRNTENWLKFMKIANIDKEVLHNFWTTWGVSMKFSGNMWFMIISNKKQQGFTLSLEDKFFEKPQGWGEGSNCSLPSPATVLGLSWFLISIRITIIIIYSQYIFKMYSCLYK